MLEWLWKFMWSEEALEKALWKTQRKHQMEPEEAWDIPDWKKTPTVIN